MLNDLDAMLGKDFDVREMARSADVPLRATRNGYELDMPDEDIAEEMPPMDVEPTAQPEQESADPFEVLGQVGTTVYDLPNMLIRGILRAGGEAAYSAGVIDETQANTWRKMLDLSGKMAEDEGVFPIARGLGEGLAQFGAGMFPAFKAMRAMGVSRPAAALISEGLSGAFGFNPDDPNVGNFINSFEGRPEWLKAIGDFIETDPNDTEAENRFRNMLQDVVPSAFIEGLVKVVSKVRNMDADTLIEAGGEAEQRLDSMMSGTTLSANPVGAAGDALVAGAGKVAEAIKPVEPAPVFYSAVANAVDALPMEKGNASQMRAMIAKSAEVKPEEMAWIGLDDFLKGKKSVTKQEIKDFVDANQVRIEEVVKGGREIDADYITKLREAEARYTVAEHDIEFDADEGGFVTYLYGEPLYDFGGELRLTKTEEEAREVLYDQALESAQQIPEGELLELGNTTGPGGLIKFSDYTLPGGENYREVLLRLPSNEPVPITKLPDGYEVAPLEGHPTAKYTLVGPSGVGSPVGGSTLEEATDQAIERLSIDPPKSPEFTGGHYDESNVLAHMRLNDRTGPNGEKILFVEEIQSDWHQKGRKQGYKTSDQFAEPFQVKSQEDSDSYIMYEVRDANGELITNVGSEYAQNSDQAIVVAQGRIRDQTRLVAGDDRFFVPDAPLKKTWHEMSFRRIARMAAEEGYDAIAWTPGKLQAERYDLSTRIDGIEVIPEGNNQVEIMVKAKGEDSYQTLATNVPEDKIADHIGKELAEKAMKKIGDNSEDTFALSREYDKFNKRVRDGEVLSDADGDRMNEVARLLDLPQEAAAFTGVDLEIGGEGMKGFYDKMLKGYASKWGKKFGAKVGVTDLETGKGMKIRRRGVDSPLEQETKTEKVWTLPVTKKMRDSVLGKGVATFGAAGVAAGLNNEARPNGD